MSNQKIKRLYPSAIPGFEAQKAIARMMDNTELWWRTLAIFYAHYEYWEETWRASQASFDAERKCVHALHSSATSVGANLLAAAAAALENALMYEESTPKDLVPLRAQVLTRFHEVRQSAQVALNLPGK
jgi:HPt (histidine-containing phosphotransfer) domain-containing protein